MNWLIEAVRGLHTRREMHPRKAGERPFLDAVRWASAAVVAVGHAITMILVPKAHASVGAQILNVIADLRVPAVLLFFVLSGYLVGGGVLLRSAAFDWRRYATARFARIYIVLLPAILLLCLLDGTGHLLDASSPVYTSSWRPTALGHQAINDHYHPINWFVTVFSVESVVAEPLGSGNAFWSLGYEWVFYFVFPLLVLPFRNRRSLLPPLVPIAGLLALLMLAGRGHDAFYFSIWVAGAYARALVAYADIPAWIALGGLVVAIVAVALPPSPLHILTGLGFAIYLSRFGNRERGLLPRYDRRLADFSYSLYVVHLPIMVFVTLLLNQSGIVPAQGLEATGTAAALISLLLIFSIVVGWFFGIVFEARTDEFRAWLMTRGTSKYATSAS